MTGLISGREGELAELNGFLDSVSGAAAALVLEGEAGMGKTTIWRAGVAEAEAHDFRVLRAVPAESETSLGFSGLGDLLDPVLDDALASIPAGQRSALARALVLEEAEGAPPDARAVGMAVLNALRAQAEVGAVIVAVDDVQWLDPASAGALAYAARRLRDERVGVLLSRRSTVPSTLVDELRRSLPAGRFGVVAVGPLEPGSLHHVVQSHLGVALPRPLLAEVHQASGGNPFFALEIVRMLRRSKIAVEAGHPLPVPESLHDLVHSRLLALPSGSRDFLLAAAAHAHPTIAMTESASGIDREAGLTPAVEARIVELEGDRIRFTHPLLAAGAYETADPRLRARTHARLAELLEDPEARAWQLAASVDHPDDAVADALEAAAVHARGRGALRPAALLLDRARELTPPLHAAEASRRAVEAANLHFESGDSRRAESQLEGVIRELPRGRQRANALVRLARVRSYDAQDEAASLFLQAIDDAEGDRVLLARAHEGVATCLFRLRERLGEAVDHADIAAGHALEVGDDALAAEALGTKLLAETLLGRATARETAARALALQESSVDRRVLAQPLFALAVHWWWTDDVHRARDTLIDMLSRASELGDESSLPYVLVLLGRVECLLGALGSASLRAQEGRQAAEQSGQHTLVAYNRALEAFVDAQLGRVDEARCGANDALERVPATGGRPAELVAREALGHLELSLADPGAAVTWLAPAVAFARREHIAEPTAVRFVVDHVEASIELGHHDEALEVLEWYEGNARELERASALAPCARSRGLLAAAGARVEDAIACYEEALAWHAHVDLPLDRGRTLLALGAAQRRSKRRREARETLEQALGVFEAIGAALWAERARSELKRISGRAATPGALTPAEERVAALVAEGKTNREVAAALYLSERTVEGHLSHVFGKLGVRSRTELVRALAAEQGAASPNPGDSPVSGVSSAP